ncbi:MAG: alpha/beta family hydrolase [Hyphomicrobium sp.]
MSHEKQVEHLHSGPLESQTRLVLAHGAGAGMDSPFLNAICEGLADRGVAVTRFEFAYMAARRSGGSRRPPPRAEALASEYLHHIGQLAAIQSPRQRLIIGGKSLGGRVASMIADKAFCDGAVQALVCLGYPFHPPKKPDRLRTAHLESLQCPALIVQGERDPFGNCAEISQLNLSSSISLHWARDGDHDLGPRSASGFTRAGNLAAAAAAIAAFADRLPPSR